MGNAEKLIECLTPDERNAFNYINSIDKLNVKLIPKSESKTADFWVEGDDSTYVIEVKSRDDDKDWKRSLRAGDVASKDRALGSDRWAEDVAQTALKQIVAVDSDHKSWWMLCLSIDCLAARETMFEQSINSMFGIRQVVVDAGNKTSGFNCLYAKPGVFERHKNIVASIILQGTASVLCVNELATDFTSFQSSILFRYFSERGGVYYAKILKEDMNFLAVEDTTINRRNDSTIEKYLEVTYAFKKATMMDIVDHSASQQVSKMNNRKVQKTAYQPQMDADERR